jgi:septal ring-binding cell division protein DamX
VSYHARLSKASNGSYLVTSEPDDIGANNERETSADLEGLSFRLTELDRHLRDALAGLREQSDRLESMEQRSSPSEAQTEPAPERSQIWTDTVRRFTGSIDVRLDILEDELGGMQEELNRLRQEALYRADAVQRRLTHRYMMGQAFIGVLILVLFLVAWSAGGNDSEVVTSAGESTSPSPTSRLALRSKPTVPPKHAGQAPLGEASADGATVAAQAPRSGSEPDAVTSGAEANALRPQRQVAVDPSPAGNPSALVPAQPVDRSTERQMPDPSGTPIVPEPPTARGQQIPSPRDEPSAPLSIDDRQPPSATNEGQGTEPVDAPQPQQVQGGSEVPEPGDSATLAEDKETPPELATGIVDLQEERFAIQLISFNSESSVEPFARKFGIVDSSRYLRTERGDKIWYSVLIGNYATREKGTTAVDALPAQLRELNPWVRSLPAGTRLVPVDAPSEAASNE